MSPTPDPPTNGSESRSARFVFAFAALTLALSLMAPPISAAVAGAATSPAPTAGSAPRCAWPVAVGPDGVNAALDDSDAEYWVLPYKVEPDLRVVLNGRFADARYTSLTTYDSASAPFTVNGVTSELSDYQTAPSPGSVNPWQETAPPGGSYRITVQSRVAAGERNVLPLAPTSTKDGSTGYLVYRVYVPADASSPSLPTVVFEQGAQKTTLPMCSSTSRMHSPGTSTAAESGGSTAAPGFARSTSSTGSLFPNPDNAYLSESLVPPGGNDVLVVRGQAPTTPAGDSPEPWPSSAQVRYWSLCTYTDTFPLPVVMNTLPDGSVDYGCRDDLSTSLDSHGYYTFVVGTEAQRSAIESVPGVTFVPFSDSEPTTHVILIRNLLGDFPEAVQNVPADGSPATAQAVMGSFYPESAICPLSALADLSTCLANPST